MGGCSFRLIAADHEPHLIDPSALTLGGIPTAPTLY